MTILSKSDARPRNRRGEGARLKEELLDAALNLLDSSTTPIGELSLRRVAHVAGVAPQSVYLHFRDHATLLWSVYCAAGQRMADVLELAPRSPYDPTLLLRKRAEGYVAHGVTHPSAYTLLFHSNVAPPGPHDTIDLPLLRVVRLLEEGVEEATRGVSLLRAQHVEATIALWSALDGAVTLPQRTPSFPWVEPRRLVAMAISSALAHVDNSSPQRPHGMPSHGALASLPSELL